MSAERYRVEGGRAVTYRGRMFTYGFTPSGCAWVRGPLGETEDMHAFRVFLRELRASGARVQVEANA